LTAIFLVFTKKSTLRLTASARKKLLELFTELHAERDRAFGNGRLSRNIFEQAVERQADRIAGQSSLDEKTLCTITRSDIPDREDLADSPGR
jgi:stage V sporulation protein K